MITAMFYEIKFNQNDNIRHLICTKFQIASARDWPVTTNHSKSSNFMST